MHRKSHDDGPTVDESNPGVAVQTVEVTLGQTVSSHLERLRAGDAGMLPVVFGLLLIAIVFQGLNDNFLSANNLVNLLVQGSVYVLIAVGTVYVLMIAEVDLSVGFVAGIAGVVAATVLRGGGTNVWLACGLALAVAAVAGLLQGIIITSLNLPSFVVTLGGQLAFMGVMLLILGDGGTLPINSSTFNAIANGIVPTSIGWGLAGAVVCGYVVLATSRRRRLQALDRQVPSWALVGTKVALVVVCAVVLMVLFSVDRGRAVSITGVPTVLVVVAAVVVLGSFLLERTTFGRYVRAVGGSSEAARRAGIPVQRIRLYVFVVSGLTAGVGGLVLASRLRSVSTNLQGGQLVLYCIAAAVIGGTSMFGGRGKVVHALLGGLVIAGIDNGMGLLGLSAAAKFIVTGVVLLIAVSIDAVARRNRTAAGIE